MGHTVTEKDIFILWFVVHLPLYRAVITGLDQRRNNHVINRRKVLLIIRKVCALYCNEVPEEVKRGRKKERVQFVPNSKCVHVTGNCVVSS